jgi:uncharacterized protein
MRVAVVGAGGAGLTAAWLLEEAHDVVVFERAARLGGHAHTVDVEVDGRTLAIDAGFQFFGPGAAYPTFNRLLDALGVRRREYRATMSLFRRDTPTRSGAAVAGRTVALPPVRRGRPSWESFSPRALRDLITFRRVLSGIPAFLERRDLRVTIGAYIDALHLPRAFTDGFFWPLLLGFWCVEPEELREFAAYNALFYLGQALSDGFHPPIQYEIDGGMRVYVTALASSLRRAETRTAVDIVGVRREGGRYTILDAAGRRDDFDHVVLATSAEEAGALLADIPGLESTRRQLDRFEYFDTAIAVHGDLRLMPARRSAWSVVNAGWDGVHTQLSVWNPESGLPVFRSWVTYEERMPEPLYATAHYRHGKITLDYFDAQTRLAARQGEHGLWLAGLYTDDADSHESAVHSAVTVAQALAPGSARLRLLTG